MSAFNAFHVLLVLMDPMLEETKVSNFASFFEGPSPGKPLVASNNLDEHLKLSHGKQLQAKDMYMTAMTTLSLLRSSTSCFLRLLLVKFCWWQNAGFWEHINWDLQQQDPTINKRNARTASQVQGKSNRRVRFSSKKSKIQNPHEKNCNKAKTKAVKFAQSQQSKSGNHRSNPSSTIETVSLEGTEPHSASGESTPGEETKATKRAEKNPRKRKSKVHE